MAKLEPYHKKLSYSYALGVFPSLMLLEAQPKRALRLLIHPDGEKNEGVQKLREKCASLGVREEIADRVLRRESKRTTALPESCLKNTKSIRFLTNAMPCCARFLIPETPEPRSDR